MIESANDARIADYLDAIDRVMAWRTYDLWRLAYARGLVTAAELSRFLSRFNRHIDNLYQTFSTEELP